MLIMYIKGLENKRFNKGVKDCDDITSLVVIDREGQWTQTQLYVSWKVGMKDCRMGCFGWARDLI